VAVVLLIASLAATGMLSATTLVALVLGVNIGGALPSVINAGSSVGRRLPLGNLLVRALGAAAVLPLAGWLAALNLDPAALVVYLHTGFNLLLALVFIGFTGPMAKLLTRLLPEPARDVDPGMPRYLDEAGLEMASIGLSNAAREALRIADMLSAMLARTLQLFHTSAPACADEVRRIDQSTDLLSAAIRAYLADIGQEGISDSDADRAQEILTFVINLEHAADILCSSLTQLAMRRLRRGEHFSVFELRNIAPLHEALLDSLSLAITVFLREDIATAHQLISRKETVRRLEADASRQHFRKLQEDKNTWAESGDIFQRVLRDYRRVHHHIAALAYPLLERAGEPLGDDQANEVSPCAS
jgi:phosphate:Na+ symporter